MSGSYYLKPEAMEHIQEPFSTTDSHDETMAF